MFLRFLHVFILLCLVVEQGWNQRKILKILIWNRSVPDSQVDRGKDVSWPKVLVDSFIVKARTFLLWCCVIEPYFAFMNVERLSQ